MKARLWSFAACAVMATTLATAGRLEAEPATFDVTQQPVINVQLRSGALTIRTWDRQQVQVEGEADVHAQHFTPQQTARGIPNSALLMGRNATTVRGPVTLPPENIPLPALGPGPHDGVVVRGEGDTTITVPSGAALIAANIGRGTIDLQNYRGVFVTQVFNGSEHFANVGGVGIAQVINGAIVAQNSDFAHVRARTLRGNLFFENCQAREIEASSIMGSVSYDNGSFQPGLARFESQYGNVAVGVNGRAQVGAHSASGQIYASGLAGNELQRNGSSDAQASFGGGGPLVTATSENGTVLIYNGSLRSHPDLQPHFQVQRPPNGQIRDQPHPQQAQQQQQFRPRRRRPAVPPDQLPPG